MHYKNHDSLTLILFRYHESKSMNMDWKSTSLRVTSHTRLRAQHHCTSSTLIGGKGGVGPSSLHITLEGPMQYMSA